MCCYLVYIPNDRKSPSSESRLTEIHCSKETNRAHASQSVQRQQGEAVWRQQPHGYPYRRISLVGLQRVRAADHQPLLGVGNGSLAVGGAPGRELGQHARRRLLIGRIEHLRHRRRRRQTQSVHPDPPLALAGGVEQRGLEGHLSRVSQIVLYGHLHCEPGVRVDVGEGEEVGGPDEEVAVEGVRDEAARAADAHHRLEADLAAEIAAERVLEFGRHRQVQRGVVAY